MTPLSGMDDTTRLRHLAAAAAVAGLNIERFVLPETRDAVISGLRIHFLDWGSPNLPPVMFLHGGGLTAHTWDLTCLALRDRFRCIAPDLRGHGDSEWSPEMAYSITDQSGDMVGLADHLGLTRFAVVGMSLGGMVAMAMAGGHPECLTSLTIVDAGTEIKIDATRRIRKFMTEVTVFETIEDAVARALDFNPRRDPRLLRNSLLHNLRRLPDGRWAWKHDNRHREEGGYYEELIAEVRALPTAFERVDCPVLVVRGEESEVLSEEDAEQLAGSFADAEMVVIPGAGHTVQGDNPAALVEALGSFLSRFRT